MATEQQTTNRLQGYPPSADPDQVVYADQSRRLIDRELDEPGVTNSAIRSRGSSSRTARLNNLSYGSSQMRARVRARTSKASGGNPPICRNASPSSHGR